MKHGSASRSEDAAFQTTQITSSAFSEFSVFTVQTTQFQPDQVFVSETLLDVPTPVDGEEEEEGAG